MKKPEDIVRSMLEKDAFSNWLGIEIVTVEERSCVLKMTIGKDMLNGLGIGHGGVTYSFADTTLAFCANALGTKSVSIETSISHTKACFLGDVLQAKATEKFVSSKTAIYEIVVTNQKEETVALFKGTVYRRGKEKV